MAEFGSDLPVLKSQYPVRNVVESDIMGDNDDELSPISQIGQQLRVEGVPGTLVLLGGPFVEHVDRTILQKRRDQRQAFPLSERQSLRGSGQFNAPGKLLIQPPDPQIRPCYFLRYVVAVGETV